MASFYFYYAAMNAGKTTSLLQTDHNYHERGMNTVIFTHSVDTRYGKGIVRSRIGLQKNAMSYDKDFDLMESGLLDSFMFIELFSKLEDEGIEIIPTRIDRELLRTPGSIEKLIKEILNNEK